MKDPIWSYFFQRKETDETKSLKLLSLAPIFEDFKKRDLKKIYRIVHQREYKKDEVIFTSRDPGVGMYIVSEGSVGVYVVNPESEQEELVAKLISGQSFGDIALFSESPRSATVRAHEPSTLLGFCKPDLVGFINRHPELGAKVLIQILGLAGKRLEMSNQQLVDVKRELSQLKAQADKMGLKLDSEVHT